MTLVEDIQQQAVDPKSDLGTVLRKCKILAARLGSRPLEDWLLWESNGYPPDVEVPDYRMWPLELKGYFSGPFGSSLSNAPIPWLCLPENLRESYKHYRCRQSIASIEETLRKSDDGFLTVSTGDLAVALGTKVYQGNNCLKAWGEFGVGHLYELLNAVRNRVLDFALAVWKESPTAGETSNPSGEGIEPQRVNQIFNTTVYGGAASLVGSATSSPVSIAVTQGDFSALQKVLESHGVQDSDIRALRDAIVADEAPTAPVALGPRVSSWIAGMTKKAAEGTWQVGIAAAGQLLAGAISRYYGC